MRPHRTCLLAATVLFAAAAAAQSNQTLAYDSQELVLANDRPVAVVPGNGPNIVSVSIPVAPGSRNAVEPDLAGPVYEPVPRDARTPPRVSASLRTPGMYRATAAARDLHRRLLVAEHPVDAPWAQRVDPCPASLGAALAPLLASMPGAETARRSGEREPVIRLAAIHPRQLHRIGRPLLDPAHISFPTVIQKTASPLIDFRILFRTGTADEPAGQEGLAQLTAMMIADAGSRIMTYDAIRQALVATASAFEAEVDREMTVFTGRTHRDNLATYYNIIAGQLLDPGFREEDFRRVRSILLRSLRAALPGSSVEALTLDDVRRFYQRHYTQRNLQLRLAGDLPEDFALRVTSDLALNLPPGDRVRPVAAAPPRRPDALEGIRSLRDPRATAVCMGLPIAAPRAWIAPADNVPERRVFSE